VQRLDSGELAGVVALAPGEEAVDGMHIGCGRVAVANGGGKEFQKAARDMLAGIGGNRRYHDRRRDRAGGVGSADGSWHLVVTLHDNRHLADYLACSGHV
jgi:hypothetical protein